jgi:hypothetical protein
MSTVGRFKQGKLTKYHTYDDFNRFKRAAAATLANITIYSELSSFAFKFPTIHVGQAGGANLPSRSHQLRMVFRESCRSSRLIQINYHQSKLLNVYSFAPFAFIKAYTT